MSEWLTEDGLYYVYAEYNPYWIYMGWWLYAIPVENVNEDKKIDEWAQATWLNYDWRLDALMEGIGCPKLRDYRGANHTESYLAFVKKCPAGVVCRVKGDGRQFIPQESELLGDYLRRVRQRQLDHIAKAQEEREKTESK
uniref:Uncharacterized protein n=1 Tax=viral metagenome TaxID=1070528 RepID=A0A6M3MCJ5_9ZZZZ